MYVLGILEIEDIHYNSFWVQRLTYNVSFWEPKLTHFVNLWAHKSWRGANLCLIHLSFSQYIYHRNNCLLLNKHTKKLYTKILDGGLLDQTWVWIENNYFGAENYICINFIVNKYMLFYVFNWFGHIYEITWWSNIL